MIIRRNSYKWGHLLCGLFLDYISEQFKSLTIQHNIIAKQKPLSLEITSLDYEEIAVAIYNYVENGTFPKSKFTTTSPKTIDYVTSYLNEAKQIIEKCFKEFNLNNNNYYFKLNKRKPALYTCVDDKEGKFKYGSKNHDELYYLLLKFDCVVYDLDIRWKDDYEDTLNKLENKLIEQGKILKGKSVEINDEEQLSRYMLYH